MCGAGQAVRAAQSVRDVTGVAHAGRVRPCGGGRSFVPARGAGHAALPALSRGSTASFTARRCEWQQWPLAAPPAQLPSSPRCVTASGHLPVTAALEPLQLDYPASSSKCKHTEWTAGTLQVWLLEIEQLHKSTGTIIQVVNLGKRSVSIEFNPLYSCAGSNSASINPIW